MAEEVIVSDDWTKNWQASIAIKITALVMWVIIVAVFITATYFLKDMEGQLKSDFEAKADRIAYNIASLLNNGNDAAESSDLTDQIAMLQKQSGFSAISLSVGPHKFYVGDSGQQQKIIERHLPNTLANNLEVDLKVFHPGLDKLVEQRRNHLVITIFVTLFVFGLFLTWSIRTIVHRPLQQLVSATRAISEGRKDIRLDISREDEFGYLSRFFNQMLDRLMDQQKELEVAAEEARSVSRAKSAFLANMSHELRTPLNAIIGYSEMLQEEAEDIGAHELKPDLDKINSAGTHLLSLINDVLDLSKIEAGKIEIEPTMFHIRHLVNDVVDNIQPLITRNCNELNVDAPSTLGRMFSDETKLRQVLVNLLSNAAKFTENGSVELRVSRLWRGSQEWVDFTVKDTGIGIAADKIDRLFKEFSQVDSSSTRKYSGTGLGLAISRRFCEKLGGGIEVESQPGKGTTFTMHVPADVNAAGRQTEAAYQAVADTQTPAEVSKILIVDQDPLVRDLIGRFLSSEGYHVLIAGTQENALEMAQRERLDVILLDAGLCQGEGCNLYEYLHKDPGVQNTPVILLGGRAELARDKLSGAAGFIEKPVDRGELKRLLGAVTDSGADRTVMVVDDNAASRDMLSRTFQGQNIRVIEAQDGQQALAMLEVNPPQLICTDLILPHMNGFDFIRQLRQNPHTASTPVVVVTAMDLTEIDRQELESSRAVILQKGVNLRQNLMATMQQLKLA